MMNPLIVCLASGITWWRHSVVAEGHQEWFPGGQRHFESSYNDSTVSRACSQKFTGQLLHVQVCCCSKPSINHGLLFVIVLEVCNVCSLQDTFLIVSY